LDFRGDIGGDFRGARKAYKGIGEKNGFLKFWRAIGNWGIEKRGIEKRGIEN
jgi:inhibitor of KinA sporulation pathway (predicted exonuclease)